MFSLVTFLAIHRNAKGAPPLPQFFHADCKWNAPKYSWKFTDEKQNSNVFLSVTNHQGFFKKRLPTYQGCMKYCDSILNEYSYLWLFLSWEQISLSKSTFKKVQNTSSLPTE